MITIFTKDQLAKSLTFDTLVSRMNEQLVRVRAPGSCRCAHSGCTTRVTVPCEVGSTRMLFCLLAPMVLQCRVAALFVEPVMVHQVQQDYVFVSEHFEVPSLVTGDRGHVLSGRPILSLFSYMSLSMPAGARLLTDLKPDLIIMTERVMFKGTARADRLSNYASDNGMVMLNA